MHRFGSWNIYILYRLIYHDSSVLVGATDHHSSQFFRLNVRLPVEYILSVFWSEWYKCMFDCTRTYICTSFKLIGLSG